ncbi:NipSnap-like protein [Euroglyphus maynei]|uniref:NipSnap-like protein n=1 Tax=Euroglyphus maynei TaxID=6958 RepID=A0A1Y3BPA0_EURMA|nr:NipSnap-like protein [Euroglyphus maynei]
MPSPDSSRRLASSTVFITFGQQQQLIHDNLEYDDLQARREIREAAWRKPGWDECVAYTVPLIREMRTRWMSPNPFSPIK